MTLRIIKSTLILINIKVLKHQIRKHKREVEEWKKRFNQVQKDMSSTQA